MGAFRLTQTAVMGEHTLQPQTVLPLVPTALAMTPQRHISRAVTDVVGCHDGSWKAEVISHILTSMIYDKMETGVDTEITMVCFFLVMMD